MEPEEHQSIAHIVALAPSVALEKFFRKNKGVEVAPQFNKVWLG
nr:MAG TPA: hypothetical protein [Caudoviricetes sp.]